MKRPRSLQQGQSLVEYSLILALIVIAAIAALSFTGLNVKCKMAWASYSIETSIGINAGPSANYIAANCAVLGSPYDLI